MSDRRTLHTFVATFVATLVLNGCAPPAEPAPKEPAPPAGEPAPPAGEPGAPALGTWTNIQGEEGVGLMLTSTTGDGVLQIACLNKGPSMVVRVAAFEVVESEERLSFGVDNEPFVFVADTQNKAAGVEASGPISEDILARLQTAKSLSVNYGASNLGPMAPPSAEQAKTFADACRKVAGSGSSAS